MNTGDFQLRAQSELRAGESLYWSGSPNPRRAALLSLPAALMGIPFAGFALFWIYGAYTATHTISRSSANSLSSGFEFFPVFGLPFLLIGVSIILAPLWAYLKSLNTVYAITNQRVMIISGRGTRAVKSLTPADILGVDYRERPDGAGDVLIRTTALPGRQSSARFQANASLATRFYGVPNVKDVAEQVMRLQAQRPAA